RAPIRVRGRRRRQVLLQKGQRLLSCGNERPEGSVRAGGVGAAEVVPEGRQRFLGQFPGPRPRRRSQVPNQDGGVRTRGQDNSTVGAEGAAGSRAAVPLEGTP